VLTEGPEQQMARENPTDRTDIDEIVDIQELEECIQTALDEFSVGRESGPTVKEIQIVGSVSEGEFVPNESDVDIIILTDERFRAVDSFREYCSDETSFGYECTMSAVADCVTGVDVYDIKKQSPAN
jgi:hypothetical protein